MCYNDSEIGGGEMEKISNTAERLKELMKQDNLRAVDIVKKCEPIAQKYDTSISKYNVSKWLSGAYLPNQAKLVVLAEALNTTD